MSRLSLVLLLCGAAFAQQRPFVRASGEGVVSFKPDQMRLVVSVAVQAPTAQQAAELDSTRTNAVLDALRKALGTSGDLRTISYSVNPVYSYPQGSSPVLTGYTATNTVEATTGDLSIAGALIDTAVSAGATSIGGLSFSLRDPQPARQQALKLATQMARAGAEAIASGLNAKLGTVVSVVESSTVTPVNTPTAGAGLSASTPIQTGNLEVRASVVLQAEIQ